VVDTALATTLGKDGVRVGTVEHLLAALSGMGIDNVRVELDGPEVPIMDGSAQAFAQCVVEAGIREQDEAKTFLVIRKTVSVGEPGKEASLSPSRTFRIDCEIDFSHPLIHDQAVSLEVSDRGFAKELCRARTFGFLRDVERLKSAGLARGGSLDNAIVVDEYSILNPEGLRFPDEFVRHKALDAVGDLSLLGHPVIGHLKAVRSGHALNHKLVQKVLSDESSFVKVKARRDGAFDLRLPELGGALEPMVA
jgi:UDP-3-O-[3-hydroxymyristoyl] N-acetylglucosamine deacetylase